MWIMAVPVYASDLTAADVQNVIAKKGKWSLITGDTQASLQPVQIFVCGYFGLLTLPAIIKK